MRHVRVLIADDDEYYLALLCALLAATYPVVQVTAVSDGAAALAAHTASPFDVIVTDYQMPHLTGLELVQQLRARQDATPVMLMSAHAHIHTLAQGIEAMAIMTKPVLGDELAACIMRLLGDQALRSEASYNNIAE